MRDLIASFRWLVLPWGATSGKRLILDGVNGEISAYDANGDETTQFDTEGLHFYDSAHTEQVTIGPDVFGNPSVSVQTGPADSNIAIKVESGEPLMDLTAYDTPGGSGTSGRIQCSQVGAGLARRPHLDLMTLPGPDAQLSLRGESQDGTVAPYIAARSPLKSETSGGTVEVWTNLPALQNGWVVSVQPEYRKYPDHDVQLRGRIANGTNVVGTLLSTLPVDYRPPVTQRFVCASGNATNTYAMVQIGSNGQIILASVAAAPASLDLSQVRFSTLASGA